MSAATTITAPIESDTPERLALATTGLEPDSAMTLRTAFGSIFDQADRWIAQARLIKVTDVSQVREMKFARESRLALRAVRVEAEHTRKRLKEDSVRRGKAIDGVANVIKDLIEPIEAMLLEQETFAERAEEARRAELRVARAESLRALGADPATFADLGMMADEAWASTIESARLAAEAKVEAAKQAEAVRIEAERLAAEARATAKAEAVRVEAARVERERLQKEENERLRAEAKAEREAAQIAAQEAELAAKAAKLDADRVAAEQAAAAKVERDRVEAERVIERAKAKAEADAIEAARKAERAEAEARETAAREATEKAARELAAVKAAAEAAAAERAAIDAARAEEEADAKKPTKAKYALLVEALTKIAAWGDDLESCDEPHAATRARDALNAVGLGR